MFVQQQIIKNNIKTFIILSKDKTAGNNSNENEPLQWKHKILQRKKTK